MGSYNMIMHGMCQSVLKHDLVVTAGEGRHVLMLFNMACIVTAQQATKPLAADKVGKTGQST